VGVQVGMFASLSVFCCEAWLPPWPLCRGCHHCCCLAIGSPSCRSHSRHTAVDAAALGMRQVAVLLTAAILTVNVQSPKQKKNNIPLWPSPTPRVDTGVRVSGRWCEQRWCIHGRMATRTNRPTRRGLGAPVSLPGMPGGCEGTREACR